MPHIKKNISTFSHIDLALKWVDRGATQILNNGKLPVITLGYDDENDELITGLQNSKSHAMIDDIADQAVFKTPAKTVKMADYDIEEAKALLVRWFERECSEMNEPLRHGSRIVECPFYGEKITIRASTTKFLKKETINFIEWLYATGNDGGVKWSEKALRQYQEYKEAQK